MTELSAPMTPALMSAKVATSATVMTPSVTAYSAIAWPLSGPWPGPKWCIGNPLSISPSAARVSADDPRLWESWITLSKERDGARGAGLQVRGGAGMARRAPCRGDRGRPAVAERHASARVPGGRRVELEPGAPVPGVDPVVHNAVVRRPLRPQRARARDLPLAGDRLAVAQRGSPLRVPDGGDGRVRAHGRRARRVGARAHAEGRARLLHL